MVQINFAQKTVNVKIVYYGPGMSGKTTNLEVVHQRAPDTNRGELTSISTDGDRTLFFDYMPLDLGTVAGMRTCFQLYTVPGQVYYNSTRKLVLQGVDGVIFIADSSASMLDQNLESLRNLEENLNEYGKSLSSLPHVIQWNKRDLPDAMPADELQRLLNLHNAPAFEGVASTGQGVFPTLKGLAASVLKGIMQESGAGSGARPGAPAPGAPAAPAAGMPPSMPAVPPASGFAPPPAPVPPAPQRVPQPAAPAAYAASPAAARPRQAAQGYSAPAAPNPASAGELMHRSPARQPAKSRTQARSHAATPAARRARQMQSASKPVKAPRKKSGAMTGIFVILAAGIGAALAWAVLKVL